jgi:hypothetical protein
MEMNEYIQSSQDVEKQFTAMMDTWMDSWMEAPASSTHVTVVPSVEMPAGPHAPIPVRALHQVQTHPTTQNIDMSAFGPTGSTPAVSELDVFALEPGAAAAAPVSAVARPIQLQQGSLMHVRNLTGSTGSGSGGQLHSCEADPFMAGRGNSSEQQKKNKILEKNRRAQKRFREKQKAKMADMEVQLAEYEQQLGQLQEEKTCLKRQNEVGFYLVAIIFIASVREPAE